MILFTIAVIAAAAAVVAYVVRTHRRPARSEAVAAARMVDALLHFGGEHGVTIRPDYTLHRADGTADRDSDNGGTSMIEPGTDA